jgi:hypothetical protein
MTHTHDHPGKHTHVHAHEHAHEHRHEHEHDSSTHQHAAEPHFVPVHPAAHGPHPELGDESHAAQQHDHDH